MITYLQNRMFADFADGPPVDADGEFVITPDRREWASWLDDLRAKYGDSAVVSAERSGFLVRKSRWPSTKDHHGVAA